MAIAVTSETSCQCCGRPLTIDNLRLALREAGKRKLDGTLAFWCPSYGSQTLGECPTYEDRDRIKPAQWRQACQS